MESPNTTLELARFGARLRFEDLSRDQVRKLKAFFLDWLGSALAGVNEIPVRCILDIARSQGGTPESTLIPGGSGGPCLMAALVNGASSHVVEMDDLHRESILHPAAAVMPALLALAEREHATGRALITSIAVGYETAIRAALGAGTDHYRLWHTTATCGTFGAAAGAASLLKLAPERFAWALGSAGTQAAGLWQFLAEGAMSKQLHAGKAAMNGLLSALLARGGFTGPVRILEGEKGFFRATSENFDEARCLQGLGETFFFERNSLKFHASCGHTHSAIEAAVAAAGKKGIPPDEIREVTVHVYQAALDLLGDVTPETPYEAKFSLPFCLALALTRGRAAPEDFTPDTLRDPALRALMDRVRVISDPRLSSRYPRRWPARVQVVTSRGQRLSGAADYPKGDPENPLTWEEVADKFNGLTRNVLSGTGAQNLIDRISRLEELADTADLLAGIVR